MDELHSMHPFDGLSCFFVIANMRIACRCRAQCHDVQQKKKLKHVSSFFIIRRFHKTRRSSCNDSVVGLRLSYSVYLSCKKRRRKSLERLSRSWQYGYRVSQREGHKLVITIWIRVESCGSCTRMMSVAALAMTEAHATARYRVARFSCYTMSK